MKAKSHTLHSMVDSDGEKDLFTPLRENATEPAAKRVENVLTLLVSAESLAREQREQKKILEHSGLDCRRSKPFMALVDESARIWGLLNTALHRYPTIPLAQGGIGRFEIIERPVTSSTGRRAPWEVWAIGVLVNLARTDELSRLRRCRECGHWFYATRPHQQFCKLNGDSCRRSHYRQNPEFKIKNATYMRERYRPIIEKEKEERSRRQAALVLTEKSKKGGK
jgi:hypothetical protein